MPTFGLFNVLSDICPDLQMQISYTYSETGSIWKRVEGYRTFAFGAGPAALRLAFCVASTMRSTCKMYPYSNTPLQRTTWNPKTTWLLRKMVETIGQFSGSMGSFVGGYRIAPRHTKTPATETRPVPPPPGPGRTRGCPKEEDCRSAKRNRRNNWT